MYKEIAATGAHMNFSSDNHGNHDCRDAETPEVIINDDDFPNNGALMNSNATTNPSSNAWTCNSPACTPRKWSLPTFPLWIVSCSATLPKMYWMLEAWPNIGDGAGDKRG
ncbi:predicted protein [Histoplasma capsulatum H143]|uniref:Uncharacterized protein n=1 Tax=Ajellomyces capsulatus (strain H143) TaxID=544712 RepID=C6HDY5_AJECH|nr:predicted protein [Histoplasma capsulatum H143]